MQPYYYVHNKQNHTLDDTRVRVVLNHVHDYLNVSDTALHSLGRFINEHEIAYLAWTAKFIKWTETNDLPAFDALLEMHEKVFDYRWILLPAGESFLMGW